jgi:uncharacterized protein (DUF983 family)
VLTTEFIYVPDSVITESLHKRNLPSIFAAFVSRTLRCSFCEPSSPEEMPPDSENVLGIVVISNTVIFSGLKNKKSISS